MRFLALVTQLSALITVVASAESVLLVRPHGENTIVNLDDPASAMAKAAFVEQFEASGITFNISYEDKVEGFMDPTSGEKARDTLKAVLSYLAGVLGYEDATLDIVVNPSSFDNNINIVAAAAAIFPTTPGKHQSFFLYRLNTGTKFAESVPEAVIKVNFAWPYCYVDSVPAPGEIDLFSVLLHEFTHAVGFASFSRPALSQTQAEHMEIQLSISHFDSLLRNAEDGSEIFPRNPVLPIYHVNASGLAESGAGFSGPLAVAEFNLSGLVPVFTSLNSPRSSFTHWTPESIPGGAVMYPSITVGEMMREYSPVDYAAVMDLVNLSREQESGGTAGCNANGDSKLRNQSTRGDAMVMAFVVFISLCASVLPSPVRGIRVCQYFRAMRSFRYAPALRADIPSETPYTLRRPITQYKPLSKQTPG